MTAAKTRSLALVLMAGVALSACATLKPKLSNRLPAPGQPSVGTAALPSGAGGVYKVGKPYQVAGVWYVPQEDPKYDATGIGSWYGEQFHNKRTANGEIFDMHALSAAHTTLPLPSMVEVTNLGNGKSIVVRLNDRGPFVGGRLIDLSHEAARQLGYDRIGTANVRVRYLGPAPLGVGQGQTYAAGATATPGPTTVSGPAVPNQPLAPVAPVTTQPLGPIAAPSYGATYAPPAYAPPTYARPTYTTPAPAFASPAPALRPAGARPGLYRVQAAAFTDPNAALRVANHLAATGDARVELVERDGAPLYRVMMQASADEGEAWALRDRVAAVGYSDAQVIRPF